MMRETYDVETDEGVIASYRVEENQRFLQEKQAQLEYLQEKVLSVSRLSAYVEGCVQPPLTIDVRA